tara:strand:+ start:356 stop:664 length:309 start_codon:yes stop_codon:yes gene_type:complete
MSIAESVAFQIEFGQGLLDIIANVHAPTKGHYGATTLPEDSYPDEPGSVEIERCFYTDEGPYAVPFEHLGVGVWDARRKKYDSLTDLISEKAEEVALGDSYE